MVLFVVNFVVIVFGFFCVVYFDIDIGMIFFKCGVVFGLIFVYAVFVFVYVFGRRGNCYFLWNYIVYGIIFVVGVVIVFV